MKLKTAFVITLLAFVFLLITSGSASANPFSTQTNADQAPAGVCALPPGTPPNPTKLQSPADGTTTSSAHVTLLWRNNNCANKYRVSVWFGNTLVSRVFVNNAHQYQISLSWQKTYTWNVRAYNDAGFSTSVVNSFTTPKAPPPPPPPPTPTPGNGGGGGGGGGGVGPPVPGTPPNFISGYRGSDVYLTNGPTGLYYSDCNDKWVGFLRGSTMYIAAMWFYPNETVKYKRDLVAFPVVTQETGTVFANGSGWLEIHTNTSSWPYGHYHVYFTGTQSHVSYCGHFNVSAPP